MKSVIQHISLIVSQLNWFNIINRLFDGVTRHLANEIFQPNVDTSKVIPAASGAAYRSLQIISVSWKLLLLPSLVWRCQSKNFGVSCWNWWQEWVKIWCCDVMFELWFCRLMLLSCLQWSDNNCRWWPLTWEIWTKHSYYHNNAMWS